MNFPAWSIIPFVALLACIAVLPLTPKVSHLWERNAVKLAVAAILGVPVAVAIWVSTGGELVTESLIDYVQFIALLASLFVVSGGVFLAGDLRATPRNNTVFLGVGAVIASFLGTTGAAMLLIRPILNTNAERKHKTHTVVFTILIVANCGGMLTPLGDPPLYIGLMQGVPFLWTFSLFPAWLFVNALLLLTFYALDRREYAKEDATSIAWDEQARTPLRVRGGLNVVWLLVIVASVAFLNEWVWVKIAVQVFAAAMSYITTRKQIRFEDNQFTWGPIVEVAVLFFGIFLTMIPALEYLREHAHNLPLNEYTFFGSTGVLSAVLDNAPTYLTFFEMGTQLTIPGAEVVAGVPHLYLLAISLGAITGGALTYIGNGPNFMIKAVAEERQVKTPSFGRYVVWALSFLAPIMVAMVCVILSGNPVVQGVGGVLAAAVVGRAVYWIVKFPMPH